MKKIVVLLLVLMLVLTSALTACSKGDETDSATVDENSTTGSSESKETDPPAGGDETDPPAGGDDELGFDFTAPWDGKSACIKWFDEGSASTGYKISNAYDLAGLSVLTSHKNVGGPVYFDSDFMVITDTDGDGDITDEEGYDMYNVYGGENFKGLTVTLETDIDLNGQPFVPIGVVSSSFQGTFDGKGHTISNFKIVGSDAIKHPNANIAYYSLFACIGNGSIVKDLTINNLTIEVNDGQKETYIAPLVGSMAGTASYIQNCNVYNVNINVTNKGEGKGAYGYIVGGISANGSKIEGCKIYNIVENGDLSGMAHSAEGEGFYSYCTNGAKATISDCVILTEDPLAN